MVPTRNKPTDTKMFGPFLGTAIAHLFCNQATGDAVAGVARGIGLAIIGFGVDYERGPAAGEYGMRTVAKRYTSSDYRISGVAFAAHGEIRDITRMGAFGILQAVMLSV